MAWEGLGNGIASCLDEDPTKWAPVGTVPEGCFFDAGCWHFSHIADQPPYTQNGKHRV